MHPLLCRVLQQKKALVKRLGEIEIKNVALYFNFFR